MQRVRQRDTAPELALRSVLHAHGIRFRVCQRDLPGRPDLVNKRRRWAVFVHGCFWHGHAGCSKATLPKTNTAFWVAKIAANQARDERKNRALEELGYLVLTVWQCELDDPRRISRIVRALAKRRAT
jgi:DNA mismatch endonuclease (patch repair protein)